MNFDGLLLALINAAAFMLSAGFLIYIISIVIPFLRHRPAAPGDASAFQWHFVVPCLDEELVIEQTVARLRADFPSGHVWCIDDASADGTANILRRLARLDPLVHMVSRQFPNAQLGKGPALNSAWRAISEWLPADADPGRVIVGVVDADGYLDPQCLHVVSGDRYFGDPSISAVQIQVRVSNADQGLDSSSTGSRLLVRMQDMEFTTVIASIQMLRHNVGSVGMGGNGQFTRLSALDAVAAEFGEPWRDALIEDFELGLHVLLTGGRNEYCHETWVSQQGPPTFRRLVRQRSRWGQGCMQCIRYLNPVLRSPKISTAAAVEITYFLLLPWLQVIGDIVYFFALLALIYASISVPGGPFRWLGEAGAWQLIPMFVIFGLGPLFIWGPIYRKRVAQELTRSQAFFLGLANWPYLFVHHCAVWWAFSRFVRSRHDWKKTERLDRRSVQPALGGTLLGGAAPMAQPVAAFAGTGSWSSRPSPLGSGRPHHPPGRPATPPWHRPSRHQPFNPVPLPVLPLLTPARPPQKVVVTARLRASSSSAAIPSGGRAVVIGRLVATGAEARPRPTTRVPTPPAGPPVRADGPSRPRSERQPVRPRTG